jgi:hypothetical protein
MKRTTTKGTIATLVLACTLSTTNFVFAGNTSGNSIDPINVADGIGHLNKDIAMNSAEFFAKIKHIAPEKGTTAPVAESGTIEYINSLSDFPAPFQGVIKLKPNKMYVVSGFINIGLNAIALNGAGIKGFDPGKDGVISAVNGAVIRSRDTDVYIESFGVICASTETKGYDLVDVTGTHFCNLFAGCSVLDAPNIQSAGVGQISGFNTICKIENYWKSADGMKITGNMEKFTSTLNYITGISKGAAYEFLSNANVKDVIIQSAYFVYSGQTGIKINKGAMIDQGRLTTNLFRGVTTLLDGFDSFTPGWEMSGNGPGVPDSKGSGYMYMNENTAPTGFKALSLFSKIMGTTKTLKSDKFTTAQSNKFVFTGKRLTTMNVFASVSARASATDDMNSYSIAIMKNGKEIILPNSTVSGVPKNAGFQLNLQTQLEMIADDYIEVHIKNNNSTTAVIVTDFQFKVSE